MLPEFLNVDIFKGLAPFSFPQFMKLVAEEKQETIVMHNYHHTIQRAPVLKYVSIRTVLNLVFSSRTVSDVRSWWYRKRALQDQSTII